MDGAQLSIQNLSNEDDAMAKGRARLLAELEEIQTHPAAIKGGGWGGWADVSDGQRGAPAQPRNLANPSSAK